MIDVKEAVRRAAAFADELFQGQALTDPTLEEVAQSEFDVRYWEVTFSFVRRPTTVSEAIAPAPPERVYKVFRVSAETGEVDSVTIRQPA